jgi:hypothetical protein
MDIQSPSPCASRPRTPDPRAFDLSKDSETVLDKRQKVAGIVSLIGALKAVNCTHDPVKGSQSQRESGKNDDAAGNQMHCNLDAVLLQQIVDVHLDD